MPVNETSPAWDLITAKLSDNFVKYLNLLDAIPGGPVILRYIKSSYKDDPIRSLFELALFLFAVKYFLSLKKKENKSELVFSKRELDELCGEWEPEPLVGELEKKEVWQLRSIPQIKGHNGVHVNVETRGHLHTGVTNLALWDFLNLNEDESTKAAAKDVISHTGVGACGPPNFYGTQDVHVRLEEDLAKYLETDEAILYGQDFVTAGSVIPAFLKRGDLCVVDSGVNLAIQKALIVSRATIEWYDHNDTEHLEKILKEIKPVLDKQPIRRRFVVTEAIFSTTGDLANLPRIVELKNKYKYRLFLDETLSIGVLGDTGRGLAEHCNVPRSEISITIGSMALSLASSGGFCAGVEPMVHHQRLNSNAYVFSASLPPYSAKVASHAIKAISENLDSEGKSLLIQKLRKNTHKAYTILAGASPFLNIVSDPLSPIIHLSLAPQLRDKFDLPEFYGSTSFLATGKQAKSSNHFDDNHNLESFVLQLIIDTVLQTSQILITRTKHILEHEDLPVLNPHLLVNVSSGVSFAELEKLGLALRNAVDVVRTRSLGDLEGQIYKY